MKTGLFLLPSLAAVCYSAALPIEDNGDVLKRDSDDYTLTVFVTAAPKATTVVKSITEQQNQGGTYLTITKTVTEHSGTVKKTTSSKKKVTTTVKNGNAPVTVYKTITTAEPVTVYITTDDGNDNSDNPDDSSDDSGDDSGDDVLVLNGNRKRQNYKRQVWLDPFTTTDYYTPDEPQPTAAASTTADYEDDEPVRTTTVWGKPHRHHTTTIWTPRQTDWSKREAAPQTDDFDLGDSSTEDTFIPIEGRDNKKREPSPQVVFTVTDDLNYPIETETYHPASTKKPSRTTTDRFGPYGSWYLTATGRHSVVTYNPYTYDPYKSVSTYTPASASTGVPDPDEQDSNDDDPSDDSAVNKRQVTFGNGEGGDDSSDDGTIGTIIFGNGGDDSWDDSSTQIYVPTVTNTQDDGETDDQDADSELQIGNEKRVLSPACNKRAIENGEFACVPSSATVAATSLTVKPTGLVEVSISRTIIQAGVSVLLTSSSSSSSGAQTTFATSTRASKL
ncbi:hypothetical protein V8E51_015620 [Hyaloscypha variabilis]